MMIACQSEEEQWHNPNVCNFITERKCIRVNYELRYDIIPRATYCFNPAGESYIGIEMEMFNYGGMLCINKYAIENIYSSMFAPICHFYIVSSENISIVNTFNDKTYGEWAKGDVVVPEFNRFFEDVFVSPLAYNHMQEELDDDNNCLVLVRLISSNYKYTFNGIFYGDNLTEWIINLSYQYIVTDYNACFNTSDCGELWKPLLTVEEHKIYEDYLKMLRMGGRSSSYNLPNTIVRKIER